MSRSPSPPLSLHQLEAQITELAGHLNAAQHRWLTLVAEFDGRLGWNDGATKSCAHWLNYRCGIDLGAAREKVRVAHALAKLPAISAAMSCGQLSYSKVRALTRVACAATEAYFLDIALHGTAAHVEKLVRCYRRVQEVEELSREARQQANRSFAYYYDEDGSLVLKGRLPAEAGALLLKALESALPKPEPRSDRQLVSAETFPQRRADALAEIAESFLKHGIECLNGGERHQIVVHVDEHTLRERTSGLCELEDGPSLAAETARRLACDASVVRVVEDAEGQPLDVGRKTRTIPPALRRALNARDRGCRFPGCSNQRYVDAHHIKHWADGGETSARNLVTLCRFHHRHVHEGRVLVERLDDGAVRFVRPDGRPFDAPAPGAPSHSGRLAAMHRECGVGIGCDTAVSLWRGEQMDYGLAIEVLLHQAQRGRDVSAETGGQS